MAQRRAVQRVQTGVRLERRLLMVLKALAAAKEMPLGELLEGIVLHAFEGKSPFGRETLAQVAALRQVYGLSLGAEDSHRLTEEAPEARPRAAAKAPARKASAAAAPKRRAAR
jgi:predicted DNA-binding ribbon-helix-helix protein